MDEQLSCLGSQPESAGEEHTAVAQALLIDAMADTLRQMPFHRNFKRG